MARHPVEHQHATGLRAIGYADHVSYEGRRACHSVDPQSRLPEAPAGHLVLKRGVASYVSRSRRTTD